jgi:hypothetical protein
MLGFKQRLPAAYKPKLGRTERVLAWAMTSPGTAVVATNFNLWIAGIATGWNHLSKVTWDGSTLSVTPSSVVEERDGYTVIADQEPVRLALADPGNLPHEVRQRVMASVRHPAHHDLGRGGLWLAGRRVPGVDGLSWIVRYDEGTDGTSPEVIAVTDELIGETRSKVVASDG